MIYVKEADHEISRFLKTTSSSKHVDSDRIELICVSAFYNAEIFDRKGAESHKTSLGLAAHVICWRIRWQTDLLSRLEKWDVIISWSYRFLKLSECSCE